VIRPLSLPRKVTVISTSVKTWLHSADEGNVGALGRVARDENHLMADDPIILPVRAGLWEVQGWEHGSLHKILSSPSSTTSTYDTANTAQKSPRI